MEAEPHLNPFKLIFGVYLSRQRRPADSVALLKMGLRRNFLFK